MFFAMGTEEAERMGTEPPPPEIVPYTVRAEHIISYNGVDGEDMPGTVLYLAPGGEPTITMEYEEFDELYTEWYEGQGILPSN